MCEARTLEADGDAMGEQRGWDGELRSAAAEAERELHRIVGYMNDRIVPEVRARTASAVHSVAGELRRLADLLDEQRKGPRP